MMLARMSPGRHNEALRESLGAFDLALSKGKAEGKVTDRLVRATFSAIERVTPNLRIDHVPNPLPAPHNLAWYFGACACPDEVRVFATMLGRGHFRVWSVAQAADGWKVLAQVFGSDTQGEAAQTAELEASTAKLRLKHHALSAIEPFKLTASNVEEFMHEYARVLLAKQGKGHFVEYTLARRY
jgi:hypothetical protein